MNGLYNFILSGLNVQLNSRATFKELGIVNIPLMYHKCTIDRFYIVQLVMAKYNDNVNVGIISALKYIVQTTNNIWRVHKTQLYTLQELQ